MEIPEEKSACSWRALAGEFVRSGHPHFDCEYSLPPADGVWTCAQSCDFFSGKETHHRRGTTEGRQSREVRPMGTELFIAVCVVSQLVSRMLQSGENREGKQHPLTIQQQVKGGGQQRKERGTSQLRHIDVAQLAHVHSFVEESCRLHMLAKFSLCHLCQLGM